MSKPMKSGSDDRAEYSPWIKDYVREVIHIRRMAVRALDEMARIDPENLSSEALTFASESENIHRRIVATCNAFLECGDYSSSALYECFKNSAQMAQQGASLRPLPAERLGLPARIPGGKSRKGGLS